MITPKYETFGIINIDENMMILIPIIFAEFNWLYEAEWGTGSVCQSDVVISSTVMQGEQLEPCLSAKWGIRDKVM